MRKAGGLEAADSAAGGAGVVRLMRGALVIGPFWPACGLEGVFYLWFGLFWRCISIGLARLGFVLV